MIQFTVKISLRSVAVFLGWLLLVGVVAAVAFPLFAHAENGNGRLNDARGVARAIQVSELVRGKPPESADEVRPYLPPFWAKRLEFSIRQRPSEGREMLYEITTKDRTTVWRAPSLEPRKPQIVR